MHMTFPWLWKTKQVCNYGLQCRDAASESPKAPAENRSVAGAWVDEGLGSPVAAWVNSAVAGPWPPQGQRLPAAAEAVRPVAVLLMAGPCVAAA